MRIATQNLNWGGEPAAPGCNGEPRLNRLAPMLASLDADLLALTEFKQGSLGDELKGRLAEGGYPFFLSRSQGEPFILGSAIASRKPVDRVELPIPPITDPWRSIGACAEGIEIFVFYFPLREAKAAYWDWVLANGAALRERDVILIGDFNTGKFRIDEAGETFDCQEKIAALEDLGFVDTWRSAYPRGRDYTWYSSAGNGFRLDYIWCSTSVAKRLERVWHDHESRLTWASDHSAVVADFNNSERPR